MKKQHTSQINATLETFDMPESWMENRLIQWLMQYGRYILFALLGLIAAAGILYRWNAKGNQQAEVDFLNAEKYFATFQGSGKAGKEAIPLAERDDALQHLRKILQRHPELHAKYDGLIAQTLLVRNDVNGAKEFADLAIARTASENSPFYTDYAQTTLIIASGQYEEALNHSLALDKLMEEGTANSEIQSFGNPLFALNFLRIGILQQQLGLSNEERATWQKWQELKENNALFASWNQIAEGQISLANYIETRLHLLSKQK